MNVLFRGELFMTTDELIFNEYSKIVKEKYLNSTFISNFDSFEEDGWNYFNIRTLGNLAFVSYHWNAGDDEGHCGTIEIGYADEDMCYWSKDCLK